MKSLWQDDARDEIVGRIRRLSAEGKPKWGRMNASQMLAHIADQIRMGLGDIPARRGSGPTSFWPMNYLIIHVLPWPHGAKAPHEAFTTRPAAWDADREAVVALIERFRERKAQQQWPEHPLFGKMSGRDWATLSYKHLNRQFGV
jgi:hypothetical protein